jgi:hypothetical protein
VYLDAGRSLTCRLKICCHICGSYELSADALSLVGEIDALRLLSKPCSVQNLLEVDTDNTTFGRR